MKQDWYPDELTQHWTLSPEEREVLDSKTSAKRHKGILRQAFIQLSSDEVKLLE